ncbi:YkoP family protein [Thermoactinomyces mirandus]|uniref:YkoP-like domain-containing protein n=1 Tax=Thermoactinomyces mirandus TaxID=2756294 RepID=A0A7W1XSQ9_9BACL|nr:hypothetical protein [Thermoactinomyces mirandus]MBA4602505.1 hypothetical protein [Thermoactinomyces mirandus]
MMQQLMIRLWNGWDMIYYKCTRLTYVDKGKNIFRVAVKPYRGEPLKTTDGYQLQPGDLYAQLHLHNVLLAKQLHRTARQEFAWAVTLKKCIRSSLPQLAQFIEQHPHSKQIKVILGTTFLHRGATRLGFEVTDIPYTRYKLWKSFGIRIIFLLCHPRGWKEILKRKQDFIPKRVFISKEKLKHYLGSEN